MVASRILIGVAGRIASGKSDLAKTVARAFTSPTVSFGDHCRKVSEMALGRQDRSLLQEIGRTLVRYPNSFSQRVLEDAKIGEQPMVVVEGIRHVEVWTSLRELLLPVQAHLIYLHVPEEEIRRRLRAESLPESEIDELEQDDTETDLLTQIPEVADLRLSWGPGRSIADFGSTVIEALRGTDDIGKQIARPSDKRSVPDWVRYHVLLSISLRRKLTGREAKELMSYEAIASTIDLDELIRGREDLRKAAKAHDRSISA